MKKPISLSKAILKGKKMVDGRQCVGTLFEIDEHRHLKACALGMAFLGSGFVTKKQARKFATDFKYSIPLCTYWDERLKGWVMQFNDTYLLPAEAIAYNLAQIGE